MRRPFYLFAPALLAASVVASGAIADPPKSSDAVPAAGGVCKSVATFASSAVPAIQQAGCVACHGGASAGATAMLDLRDLGKDNAIACTLALAKVNLADKPQSAIISAAAGALPHHGGKVADTQGFTTSMLGWINNE